MCRGRRARLVLSLTHTQTGTQGALVQYKDWAGWAVLCVVSFYSQHTVDLFEDGSEARVQGKEASLTHTNGRAREYSTITGWLRCAGTCLGLEARRMCTGRRRAHHRTRTCRWRIGVPRGRR